MVISRGEWDEMRGTQKWVPEDTFRGSVSMGSSEHFAIR